MRAATWFLVSYGLLAAAGSATAQTVEAGVGVTAVSFTVMPSVSVGAQLTQRFVVDLTAAILPRYELNGLYQIRLRELYGPGTGAARGFADVGLVGSFLFRHEREHSERTVTGDVLIWHEHYSYSLSRPNGVLIGAGVRLRTASRAVIDLAADVVFGPRLAPIFSALIVVPFGRRN